MARINCPYCGNAARLISSAAVYGGRDFGLIWFCDCVEGNAYVGCHKGTQQPLGRLANSALRAAKMRAHSAFDPLWKKGAMTRSRAYRWLAKKMNLPPEDCHIGMFNLKQCARVVAIVQASAYNECIPRAFNMEPKMERLQDKEMALAFVTGGRALFTLKSIKTGNHFTFAVEVPKDGKPDKKSWEGPWFVKVLTGPDNTAHYTMFGMLWKKTVPGEDFQGVTTFNYAHWKKSTISQEAPSVRGFSWLMKVLQSDRSENAWQQVEFLHHGYCGRCGRTLTDPVSIETGLGPVCREKMFH